MTIDIEAVPYRTTLDQIDVPDALKRRYAFHSDHDRRLMFVTSLFGGQGIAPSTVTLLTGNPGAGKSTLAVQMAQALHARSDCLVLFNGLEESLHQTRIVADRLFRNSTPPFFVGTDTLVTSRNPKMNGRVTAEAKSGKRRAVLDHVQVLAAAHPNRQPILIVDSLQCLDDGHYPDGFINRSSTLRALKLVRSFCKQTYAAAILIGQVTKSGDPAGDNKLIHNIDVHIHLGIDTKEKSETQGMRIATTRKNRFGVAGQTHICNMWPTGLVEENSLVT